MVVHSYLKPFLGLAIAAPMSFGFVVHSVIIKGLTHYNSMTLIAYRFLFMTIISSIIVAIR